MTGGGVTQTVTPLPEAVAEIAGLVSLFRYAWDKCPDARLAGEPVRVFGGWAARRLLDPATGTTDMARYEALRASGSVDGRRFLADGREVLLRAARTCTEPFPPYARGRVQGPTILRPKRPSKTASKVPPDESLVMERRGGRVFLEGPGWTELFARSVAEVRLRAAKLGGPAGEKRFGVVPEARTAGALAAFFRSPSAPVPLFESAEPALAEARRTKGVVVAVEFVQGTRMYQLDPGVAPVSVEGLTVVLTAPEKKPFLAGTDEVAGVVFDDPFTCDFASAVGEARKVVDDASVHRLLQALETLRPDDGEWRRVYGALAEAPLPSASRALWNVLAASPGAEVPPPSEFSDTLFPYVGKVRPLDEVALRALLPRWIVAQPARYTPWVVRLAALRPEMFVEELFLRRQSEPAVLDVVWSVLGAGKIPLLEQTSVNIGARSMRWDPLVERAMRDPERRVRSAALALDYRLCLAQPGRGEECGVRNAALTLVKDPEPGVRHAALGRLWYRWEVRDLPLEREDEVALVAERLTDEVPSVRLEAQRFFRADGPVPPAVFAAWLHTDDGKSFLRSAGEEPTKPLRDIVQRALGSRLPDLEEAQPFAPVVPTPAVSPREPSEAKEESVDSTRDLTPEPELRAAEPSETPDAPGAPKTTSP